LPIFCVLLICADLATARGSFLVNGWRVWNNASVSERQRVETEAVPVKITLPTRQTLWIGSGSSVRIQDQRILVEKGCALLQPAGAYTLDAKCSGTDIPRQYETLRELRPMSQRP
jgi:hypothetical protein